MKTIEINKEQKEKLLEMCTKLFPEYTFVEWDLCGHEGNLKYYHKKWKSAKFIHWFEFCLTHLLREICILRTNKDFGFDPWDFDKMMRKYIGKLLLYDEPKHPVDYLYKEFKKIK